ncbi:hypothetical protein [Oligella urethralis]|uniref:hypothetical protein n=1 Tax=Oligella urethralis TaxID=90245 RepID=UPI00288ABD76|nr:hypothetical protein [Oligella urethralis]
MRRNWKNIQPTSLTHALRLCKDHAIARKQLSVERIADLMGCTHDSLYKWLSTGRMPVVLIPVYEHVCGIAYVSRWLASSGGKLIIDIPKGHLATPEDIQELQLNLNTAVSKLINFYQGSASADETLAALQIALEDLASHRANVQQVEAPELEGI